MQKTNGESRILGIDINSSASENPRTCFTICSEHKPISLAIQYNLWAIIEFFFYDWYVVAVWVLLIPHGTYQSEGHPLHKLLGGGGGVGLI